MLEVALQLLAIFTTWSKLGLFSPHPLLSHCYYSQIILNSLPLILFSELFWHNYLRPSNLYTDRWTHLLISSCKYLAGGGIDYTEHYSHRI